MSHEMNEDALEAHESYYSNQKDHTLEDNELRKHCVLDVGRHTLQPICSLGKLDILPPELLTTVLAQLDVQSLTDFRRVNQQAMRFINSTPQYQVVVEHASDALRGMLSIGSARFSTIEDLYDKLCTATCETCSHFGGYLYLITCKRFASGAYRDKIAFYRCPELTSFENMDYNPDIRPGYLGCRVALAAIQNAN